MSLHVVSPQFVNLNRATPYQKPEGLSSILGSALGQGLGQGISSSIQQQMRQSVIDKALGMIQPGMSPLQKYSALSSLDPESRQEVLGLMQAEEAARAKQAQTSALDRVLAQQLGAGLGEEGAQGPYQSRGILEQDLAMLNPQDKKFLIDQQQKLRQEQREIEKRGFEEKKYARDVLAETRDARKNSQQLKMNLSKMKKLNESGKLTGQKTAVLLEKFNIPVSVLGNPNSEEFEKLSYDLLKGIGAVFPGRILQSEVENFLKTIPKLTNSEEGRRRIIQNMEMLTEIPEIKAKAEREVIKENKGKVPVDFEDQVFERIAPELSSLQEKFAESVAKEVPSQQEIPKGYIKIRKGREVLSIPKEDLMDARAEGWEQI